MGWRFLVGIWNLSVETVIDGHKLTGRQAEVLDAALSLIVSDGDNLTMAGVARAASCSKETLYKWFGDRNGLLTMTVQWQASKVRVPVLEEGYLDLAKLKAALTQFARDYLSVLTSATSVALNRLAISHAASGASSLGSIVLENGRRAMGWRLKPMLEAGQAAGLLVFDDSEAAFRYFFGLVIRDVQIRLLLGDDLVLGADDIAGDAVSATEQFFVLYGTK